MPDGLYERDILSWSRHQPDLLRRLARGKCVNDVDWEHVLEEIEDVWLTRAGLRFAKTIDISNVKLDAGWIKPDHTDIHRTRDDHVA
jgi:Domain of unknown function DUF29